jgi:hypothetical protein
MAYPLTCLGHNKRYTLDINVGVSFVALWTIRNDKDESSAARAEQPVDADVKNSEEKLLFGLAIPPEVNIQ